MLDTRDGTFGLCATPYAYWKFAKSVSRGQLGLSTGSTGTWLGDGYLPGVSFAATVHVNGYTYVVAANVAKRIADANGQTLRDTVVDMNPIIDRLAEMSNVPSPLEALRPIWDDAQLATLKTYEVMGVDGIKRYFATSKLSEQIDVEALPAVFTKVEQFTAYTKQFGLGDGSLVNQCRFIFQPNGKDVTQASHFYGGDADCNLLSRLYPDKGLQDPFYEDLAFAFHTVNAVGGCDAGLRPVYRLFSQKALNHRYTVSLAVVDEMTAKGWKNEGIQGCVPQ